MKALPEHLRPDPFGAIVRADGVGELSRSLVLTSGRGAFVSCQVVVRMDSGGGYALSLEIPPAIEVDVFREWFHFVTESKGSTRTR